MDIIKHSPGREEWWVGSTPSGPFIYIPFGKGEPNDNKQDLIRIVGEPVQVLVELENPRKVITLSGLPTSVGQVNTPRCIIHCFGVITKHLFKDVDNLLLGAIQGLVLSGPSRCCGSPKLRNVLVLNIFVVLSLPLFVYHVVGGDGAVILYEGEIRNVWISLANAGFVPVEQAHLSLLGKNQDFAISIVYDTLKSALPLKSGAKVTLPVTIKAWQLAYTDPDSATGKRSFGSMTRAPPKEGSSPMLVIHYAGPLTQPEQSSSNGPFMLPGRCLVIPLQVCVLQGLSFVKARLLSIEIPVHVSKTLPKPMFSDSGNTEEIATSESRPDCLISVSVQIESPRNEDTTFIDHDAADFSEVSTSRTSSFSKKNMKAELNASIKSLISRIKTSVMDILLPDPLTFSFKLAIIDSSKDSNTNDNLPSSKGYIFAHEMTPMEVLVRNNTREISEP
ncbi:hypothetical protein GIB67_012112 [Kingdonia uniflora]|uniref:Uncharacterized protein n=1 Tax=Kingdonia uniflora TaxID=39325 RepID=A0A7J7LI00_9MAGN|nr:hypothetical protein GIB67_012112 [Kingdonia uniflora]